MCVCAHVCDVAHTESDVRWWVGVEISRLHSPLPSVSQLTAPHLDQQALTQASNGRLTWFLRCTVAFPAH